MTAKRGARNEVGAYCKLDRCRRQVRRPLETTLRVSAAGLSLRFAALKFRRKPRVLTED